MNVVDDQAIRTHAAIRFRSEYHYAVFEYWRSAKVLRHLDRCGVTRLGRVLDLVERHAADGVLHHGLRLCQLYDMEVHRLSAVLKDRKIPFMNLRPDYSLEDTEQLRVRLEAFLETIGEEA